MLKRKGKTMRKKTEEITKFQKEKYDQNDKRLWAVLKQMTYREIALTPVAIIAKEAGLSRSVIYNHPSVYQHILECREKEEQRVKQFERQY